MVSLLGLAVGAAGNHTQMTRDTSSDEGFSLVEATAGKDDKTPLLALGATATIILTVFVVAVALAAAAYVLAN